MYDLFNQNELNVFKLLKLKREKTALNNIKSITSHKSLRIGTMTDKQILQTDLWVQEYKFKITITIL